MTNVLLHARTSGVLSLVEEGPCVRVRVADGSRSKPSARRHGSYESTGRGVRLLEIAENWGVEPSDDAASAGKAVWFTLMLHPSVAELRAQERKAAAAFGGPALDFAGDE